MEFPPVIKEASNECSSWRRPVLLLKRICRGPFVAFALLSGQTLLLFFSNLVLARNLGSAHFGIYGLTFATLSILTVLSTLGGRGTIIRFVASYLANGEYGKLRGILLYCNVAGLGTSIVLMGLGLLFLSLYRDRMDGDLVNAMEVMLYFLPFNTLVTLRQYITRGFKLLFLSLVPESILRPCVFLVLILLISRNHTPSASDAYWLYGWATIFSCVVGYMVSFPTVNLRLRGHKAIFEWRKWGQSTVPVIVASLSQTLGTRMDMYIIAMLLPMSQLGKYSVALKIAMILNVVQMGIRVWAAPHIAGYYAEKKIQELQNFIKKSVRFSVGLVIVPVIGVIMFPKVILNFFGAEYVEASSVLIVLVLAQFANIIFGLGGNIMLMTGMDKDYLKITIISSLAGTIVLFFFVKIFGLIGAALGFFVSTIILNVGYSISVYKKHQLRCYFQ
jgi:O-antigen/teichoic acid export membrane protein